MNRLFLALCLFFLLPQFSCKKENRCDCLKGTGEIKKEPRIISDFNVIEVNERVQVYVAQDTVCSVTAEAGENLLSNITTEVSNGMLVVRDRNRCNWVRDFKTPINVYVTVTRLDQVILRGAGSCKSLNTINSPEITLDVWGSGDADMIMDCGTSHLNIHTGVGDIKASGNSGVNYVWAAGNGYVRAGGLVSDYTFLTNKGTGDCHINVSKELHSNIYHNGNVFYSGSPAVVKTDIRGSGKLIKE